MQTSGIILAGGSSSRMGRNKALLSLPGSKNVTFVEHLVTLLEECCCETIIVARDKVRAQEFAFPGVRVVVDETPGVGPLMGIYSGLQEISTARALVVAVDLPFVQPTLLAYLLSQPLAVDSLLIPLINDIPQVLLGVYPRSILPILKQQLRQGRRDVRCLLELVPVHYIGETQLLKVDPQLRSFININTPQELRELF
jgi:molybdopterin-guanine dinucleotide biosynthesis protein A